MTEAAEPTQVIVLLREAGEGFTTVHAVLADRDALERCLCSIERQNPQYPLRQLGAESWRIGPEGDDEDEGFFGNKPVYLRAFTKQVRT